MKNDRHTTDNGNNDPNKPSGKKKMKIDYPLSAAEIQKLREQRRYMAEEMFNFLRITEYQHVFTIDNIKGMSVFELKLMFEHLGQIISSTYRNNVVSLSWDKRFNSFLSTFKFKGPLTSTQINTPSMKSSNSTALVALDFIRRLARTVFNMNPEVMFPKIDALGISTQVIFDFSLSAKRKRVNTENYDFESELQRLKVSIQKLVGVSTDEEKARLQAELAIDQILSSETYEVRKSVSEVNENNAEMLKLIRQEDDILMRKQESNAAMQAEIVNRKASLHWQQNERSVLSRNVDKCAAQGYSEILTDTNHQRELLVLNREQNRKMNMTYDCKNAQLLDINKEIQKMRYLGLAELSEVDHLMSDDTRRKLYRFEIDDAQQFDATLCPAFFDIRLQLSEQADAEKSVLRKKTEARDDEEELFAAMSRECAKLETESRKVQESMAESARRAAQLEATVEETAAEIEALERLLAAEEAEEAALEARTAELEVRLAREKRDTEEATAFFKGDLAIRERHAEVELRIHVGRHERRMAIEAARRERLQEQHEWTEALRSQCQ